MAIRIFAIFFGGLNKKFLVAIAKAYFEKAMKVRDARARAALMGPLGVSWRWNPRPAGGGYSGA